MNSSVKPNIIQIKDLPSLESLNDATEFLVSNNLKTYKTTLENLMSLAIAKAKSTFAEQQIIASNVILQLSSAIVESEKQYKNIALIQKNSFSSALKTVKCNISELSSDMGAIASLITNAYVNKVNNANNLLDTNKYIEFDKDIYMLSKHVKEVSSDIQDIYSSLNEETKNLSNAYNDIYALSADILQHEQKINKRLDQKSIKTQLKKALERIEYAENAISNNTIALSNISNLISCQALQIETDLSASYRNTFIIDDYVAKAVQIDDDNCINFKLISSLVPILILELSFETHQLQIKNMFLNGRNVHAEIANTHNLKTVDVFAKILYLNQ